MDEPGEPALYPTEMPGPGAGGGQARMNRTPIFSPLVRPSPGRQIVEVSAPPSPLSAGGETALQAARWSSAADIQTGRRRPALELMTLIHGSKQQLANVQIPSSVLGDPLRTQSRIDIRSSSGGKPGASGGGITAPSGFHLSSTA